MDFSIKNLFTSVFTNINRYKFTYISIAAIIQLILVFKNLFTSVFTNINRYKFTYISIAAIIQLILVCGLWLIARIFQLALTLAGEEHLDKNNILHILTNPYSFIILNLLILIVAFFMFIEFSILTFTIYGQLTDKKY